MHYLDDHYNTHQLAGLIQHSGVLTERDLARCLGNREITMAGQAAVAHMPVAPGDRVLIRGAAYDVCAGGGNQRLQLCAADSTAAPPVPGRVRVHAGYHKCLSEYAKKVYQRSCSSRLLPAASFQHYYHRVDAFYADCARHTISSISGHCLDLKRFEDIRVVRFIRDPRDLLVSGYFYHKRGAEHWCALENATDMDWEMVRGAVPSALPADTSLATYLQTASLEDGLLAELEFRRFHFDSMLAWPACDSRVRLFRYEDILGNEESVFNDIFDFFGFAYPARIVAKHNARKFRAGARASNRKHIRDPSSGQWRHYFTPDVAARFSAQYGALLQKYDYPLD